MKITINNLQKIAKLNNNAIKKFLSLLRNKTIKKSVFPPIKIDEISLVVTDNDGIKKINSSYFRKNSITDVISVYYQPVPGYNYYIGEIIVNAEEALCSRYSSKTNWSPSKEFALYIAHGFDHICGGEDNTPHKRKVMLSRELQWLLDQAIAKHSKQLFLI